MTNKKIIKKKNNQKTKKIKIWIDQKPISCSPGQTILEVAQENKIDIPALCNHPDLKPSQSCRLCLVKIQGIKKLQTSCSVKVSPGMKITTKSPVIKKTIQTNLELLFAQHAQECDDCILRINCQLLALARKYKINLQRFTNRKKKSLVYQFGPSIIFDPSKCINCGNCVEICKKQGINFLEVHDKDGFYNIKPSQKKNRDCIYCGQCVVHCPVGALEAVGEFEDTEKILKNKNKIVVFQFAPSIRSSIGEEFNLPHGTVLTDKLTAGIRKLGADYVFDVCVGADFTTIEEVKELLKKIKQPSKLPMFTSCCPAWVKYLEFYWPELIRHLTTARSPHIILGGLIKTFFAKKQGIDPKKISVVSVMPCVAKKYEIQRPELTINGLRAVDHVITTRELAYLFAKYKIDLKKIKPECPDSPLGLPSGAGVIYGASGGVMESALRTACWQVSKKRLPKIEFKEVRGMQGVKKATVTLQGKKLKLAVVNGIANAKKLLEELKKDPHTYDYIEVMACFGGCIGGGGQPVPTNSKIRAKRAQGLYQSDACKQVRTAHDNPAVQAVYQEYLTNNRIIREVCHSGFKRKKKEVNIK